MKHFIFFATTIFFIWAESSGQKRKVIGRVLDSETQKPIKNANIIVGSKLEIGSNHLGYFELSIDSGNDKTIVISHIGYRTMEISVPKGDVFKLFLEKEYVLLKTINLNNSSSDRIKELVETIFEKDSLLNNESDALFPKGITEFLDYVRTSLKSEADRITTEGLNIFFTINEKGQATNVSLSDTIQLNKSKVIDVFNRMPAWTPATQRQNSVSQYFVLPIINSKVSGPISSDQNDFFSYLARNISYPMAAKAVKAKGFVYVYFQVDSQGKLIDSNLLKDIGGVCGSEVMKVLENMPSELAKSLVERTKHNGFILPVSFNMGSPYRGKKTNPDSSGNYFLLDEISVVGYNQQRR